MLRTLSQSHWLLPTLKLTLSTVERKHDDKTMDCILNKCNENSFVATLGADREQQKTANIWNAEKKHILVNPADYNYHQLPWTKSIQVHPSPSKSQVLIAMIWLHHGVGASTPLPKKLDRDRDCVARRLARRRPTRRCRLELSSALPTKHGHHFSQAGRGTADSADSADSNFVKSVWFRWDVIVMS